MASVCMATFLLALLATLKLGVTQSASEFIDCMCGRPYRCRQAGLHEMFPRKLACMRCFRRPMKPVSEPTDIKQLRCMNQAQDQAKPIEGSNSTDAI